MDGMEQILGHVGTVFAALLNLARDTVEFIVETPLVLLPVLIGLTFTGIRVFKAIR